MYFSTENRMDTTEENNFDYEQSRVRVVNFTTIIVLQNATKMINVIIKQQEKKKKNSKEKTIGFCTHLLVIYHKYLLCNKKRSLFGNLSTHTKKKS